MRHALLALSLLLAPAAAQSVDSVTPDAGAFGTPLTIAGTGFGTAKPKVLLVSQDDGKARKLKVLEWSDTQIVAELRKLPAGAHDLQVQPKGKGLEPLAAPAPVTVQLPAEALFTPGRAGPGEQVTMTASGLGTKKGKVKVGGVKAKVLSWSAGSPAEGATPGTVVFKLGKKTPAGSQPVSVKTTAGEAVFQDALDILEQDPGGGGGGGIPGNPYTDLAPGLEFVLDGGAPILFGPPTKTQIFQGTTSHKVSVMKQDFSTIEIYVDYWNNVPASPTKTKTLQQPKVHLIYKTLSGIWSTTSDPAVGDVLPGTSATITVTGQVQSFFGPSWGGAFSGTLVLVSGTGPATITISDGFFWTYASPG